MSSDPQSGTARDERLNAILAEILEAAERGEIPDSASYVRAHPDLADELREFFQDWRQFRRTAAVLPAASNAPVGGEQGALPRRIGNYELLERIARGGMGVVYKARQLPLNRIVALKTLLRGDVSTADELRRFQVEAEAAAQLEHSGIVPIYEVGQHDGVPYFSMRYLAGGSLADLVADGPLEAREAARLVREIAVTLVYAHQHQVIHRDLKPANVLLEWPSELGDATNRGAASPMQSGPLPRLTDFGLAKRLSAHDSFTHSGQILGTPSYMAPEQVSHQPTKIGPTTDIYALGAILYCLLTGRPPFQAADPLATLRQVRDDPPVPPSRLNPSTPRDLETIALRCLEKAPERRFPTARALADELDRFLDGRPILTRPPSRLGQLGRWARRQPLVAALLLAVVATMVLGGGTSAYFAVQQLQRRRELERSLYRSQIIQADLEREAGNVNRAVRLLEECQHGLRNWEWHFLQRRCHPERLLCRGHDQLVSDVAYDPTGARFASCGQDGMLRIWDATTGKLLAEWPGGHEAMAVAWSADGQLVAAGLDDGRVIVWESARGARRFARKIHDGGVNDVTFSPSSDAVLTCGDDGAIHRIDAVRGDSQQRWDVDTRPAWSVAMDRQGQSVAVASEGPEVAIWNLETGERRTLRADLVAVRQIAFSPDGKRLIGAGDGDAVHVWDVASGEVERTFTDHLSNARALAVSDTGELVASGGRDGTVLVWELESGDVVQQWKAHHLAVRGLAFRPDGHDVASCGVDGLVRVWSLEAPEEIPRSSGHTERVNEIAFSPLGDLVASASRDGTVRLWDAATAELRDTFQGHSEMVLAVAFSPDGRWVCSGDICGLLCRWEIATGQSQVVQTSHEAGIWSVAVHSDSQRVVVAGADGAISLWDVPRNRELLRRQAHQGQVRSVRFHPDFRRFATSGDDATVRLWHFESGQVEREFKHAAGSIWSVAFSRDGRRLASAGSDATVIIWDLARGRPETTCVGHAGIVYAVSFSPDGQRLATAGFDETVKIWDLPTGADLLTLREHHWSVNSVAFSPDGQTIASGGSDWLVRLWLAAPRPVMRADHR